MKMGIEELKRFLERLNIYYEEKEYDNNIIALSIYVHDSDGECEIKEIYFYKGTCTMLSEKEERAVQIKQQIEKLQIELAELEK